MPIDSSTSYIPLDGSSRSGCWGHRSTLERSLIFLIAFMALVVITLSIAFAYKKCEDSNVTTVNPTSSNPTTPSTSSSTSKSTPSSSSTSASTSSTTSKSTPSSSEASSSSQSTAVKQISPTTPHPFKSNNAQPSISAKGKQNSTESVQQGLLASTSPTKNDTAQSQVNGSSVDNLHSNDPPSNIRENNLTTSSLPDSVTTNVPS